MAEACALYVEGKDDLHAIRHLLMRHSVGVSTDESDKGDRSKILIKAWGDSVEGLTAGIPTICRLARTAVAFVVDADPMVGIAGRWTRVTQQLSLVGVMAPPQPEPGGFNGNIPDTNVKVGVWLMPDNQRDGTIEVFLRDLIDDNDMLISSAESAVNTVRGIDQRFPDPCVKKAELATWLAWQHEPGCPYGTAIRARYVRVDSEAALSFVKWIRNLSEL